MACGFFWNVQAQIHEFFLKAPNSNAWVFSESSKLKVAWVFSWKLQALVRCNKNKILNLSNIVKTFVLLLVAKEASWTQQSAVPCYKVQGFKDWEKMAMVGGGWWSWWWRWCTWGCLLALKETMSLAELSDEAQNRSLSESPQHPTPCVFSSSYCCCSVFCLVLY